MSLAQSYLLRRGRFSEPGRIYLLTTITHQRKPLFMDFHNARLVINELRKSDQEQACQSLAWVVMPDHLHWLIELHSVTLATLMRRFKSRSSLALHKSGVEQAPVWESGYQDRALRRDQDVRWVARYIVANPLRAGLVGSIREYPHWDAVWL
ncbi:REP-associated tyrosine transposase [Pseudomonas oryziphila]|uniref:Transposase n=1 Tax=Pseudomonas oryziphila TaxID=2894079 RepID=A0ABM7CK46_9PSED|nr:transposase [Pseudomonas oryziphila]AZL71777.1 transposase [Pseudomonas oryziphila]